MVVFPFAVSMFAVLILLASAAAFACALVQYFRPDAWQLLQQLTPREWQLRRARHSLKAGDWRSAFATAGRLRAAGQDNPILRGRLAHFEGDCLYRAAEESLQLGRYTDALEFLRGAGDRLGLQSAAFDQRVIELILAEIRRRVSVDPAEADVARLCEEVLSVKAGHPESSFWLGFHHLHHGDTDAARLALQHALNDPRTADGALYLGVLLTRTGRAREALRFLGQAARLAPESAVVHWQLGEALLQTGSDPGAAVKALEIATGANGLPRAMTAAPHKIWAGMPASWMAAVSRRSPLVCPLRLDQPRPALISARRSLAQGLALCDRAADAANVYYQALADGDDSADVRQGLGLSLARSGLYDDARPHLEAALQVANPPRPQSVGYLALCIARCGAATVEDRSANLRDALDILTSIERPDDPEWVRLARELFRDARSGGVRLSPAILIVLARGFAAVDAIDPTAVDAYGLLAQAGDELPFEVAAAYVRAAAERGAHELADTELFDRAFTERDVLRRHFVERGWDFATAERLYLTRWAERQAGRYPDAPGPTYAVIAEALLIDLSHRAETEGHSDDAMAVMDLARQLGPTRARTLDRLAELAARAGKPDEALELLRTWERLHPTDVRPPTRAALLDLREGRAADALAWMAESTSRATGPARVRLLLLTARVALAANQPDAADELIAQARLTAPLDHEPILLDAAVAWSRRDYERFARLAGPLAKVQSGDPVRTLAAGVASFVASDSTAASAAAETAQAAPPVAAEATYLRALLLAAEGRGQEARAAIIGVDNGRTAFACRTLTARLDWFAGNYSKSYSELVSIPPALRAEWGIKHATAAGAFLAGAAELANGRCSEALVLFREARAGGVEHDCLGLWEVMAAQRAEPAEALASGPSPLLHVEAVLGADGLSPANRAWLARAYRRAGALDEARRLLAVADGPDFHWQMQRGLLAIQENRLGEAESNFDAAGKLNSESPAAPYNLAFTRLSRGGLNVDDLRRAAALHPAAEAVRLLLAFAALVSNPPAPRFLADLTDTEEDSVLRRLQRLGRLDVAAELTRRLSAARPKSAAVQQAASDIRILLVKRLIDRGEPAAALAAVPPSTPVLPKALRNLMGVAAYLSGDRALAVKYFYAAVPSAGDDARVQHNLALAYHRLGQPDRARIHWQHCIANITAHGLAPADNPNYLARLAEVMAERGNTQRPVAEPVA